MFTYSGWGLFLRRPYLLTTLRIWRLTPVVLLYFFKRFRCLLFISGLLALDPVFEMLILNDGHLFSAERMSLDLGRALKDIAMKSKMVDYSIRCPHQKISYLQPSIGFVDQKTGLIKHIDL